jgi:hypothetical protein
VRWSSTSIPHTSSTTDAASGGDLLLLYATRDRERNNAVVLRDYLLARLYITGPDDEGEVGPSG